MSPRLRLLTGAVAVAALVALTGCSSTVPLDAAPDANNPACADVSVALPATVDGQQRRWTDAQATGAWGSPAAVILPCGVPVPGPTTLECQTVGGVDWIIEPKDDSKYLVTTYGRDPAVEVFLDNKVVGSRDVLEALSPIVGVLPKTGAACTDRPAD